MTTTSPAALDTAQLSYLVAEDLKIAASLLYQAYFDDPLFMELFQADKADYEKRLRAAIREELAAFWEAAQPMVGVFDGESLVGVACLTRPGKSFGPGRYWHWRLKMLLTAGYVSTRQLLEKEALIQAAMPENDYHMLAFIAVHPRYQQQGWGDVLVRAARQLLEEDKTSAGIAVYITQSHYLPLFEQHGYRKVTSVRVGSIVGELLFAERESAATAANEENTHGI
ncbi:GNAT family N-acetyltransferase [Pseudidiomarina aestuarii]|nr:GNAT family N-acetyltransferase [Pseudidiomarina aestuarii]